MKISELIEELENLNAKHGDLIVTAVDHEGPFEIEFGYQTEFILSDGKAKKEGSYDMQSVIRLC